MWCTDWLFYWTADATARRNRGSVENALRILYNSQREITAKYVLLLYPFPSLTILPAPPPYPRAEGP